MSAQNIRSKVKETNRAAASTVTATELIVQTPQPAALANATMSAAASFIANAAVLVGNVATVTAVYAKTVLQTVGAGINGLNAPLILQLDLSNGANTGNVASSVPDAGAYLAIMDSVVSSFPGRGIGATPIAFIGFGDEANSANSNSSASNCGVQFMFDIGRNGKNVPVGNTFAYTGSNVAGITSPAGALRVRVNGTIKYVPLASAVV
jgi:hypothetical protein